MTVFTSIRTWLEQLPALDVLAPHGLCTGLTGSNAGAALCAAGIEAGAVFVSGMRCETRCYQLVLRTALLTNAEREAYWDACEAFCVAVDSASARGDLPLTGVTRAAPKATAASAFCVESVACGAPVQTAADDSGLSSFTLPLTVQLAIWPSAELLDSKEP